MEQLLAAQHVQARAIQARHAALMKRWNQLLANSAARKKKLLEAQEHFRKVRLGRRALRPGVSSELTAARLRPGSRWRTCS